MIPVDANILFCVPPNVSKLGHCMTQARRLPCRLMIVGLRVAFADVAAAGRVKQAGGRGIQNEGSGSCATIASLRST